MYNDIIMTFQRWRTAACLCCVLGVGTVTAAPLDAALTAYNSDNYAQAIKLFRPLAAQRNVVAQFYLGLLYANVDGVGVTLNYPEALKWYRLAAAQGHAGAQHNIGVMYSRGRGVTQNYREALKWHRLAAAQELAESQHAIGFLYANGLGITKDIPEAIKWWRLAAAQGYETSINDLQHPVVAAIAELTSLQAQSQQPQHTAAFDDARTVSHNGGDYAEALKWYRLAAERGDAGAQVGLGVMYYEGNRITQDYQEATKLFHLAAAQGDAYAQNNLGFFYANGHGVTQNYQEAVKWYHLAARQGVAAAQINLYWMYAIGKGVTPDEQEAKKWMSLARAQGSRLISGGVIQDPKEAEKWHRLAEVQGNVLAQGNLQRPEMIVASQRMQYQKPSKPTVDPQQSQQPEQPKRTATNKPKAYEKTLPPQLTFNSSTPSTGGTVELSGRVTSSASISEVSINGRALEVPLAKDGSFKVVRRLPMGVTTYRLSVVDEFDQRADAEVNVERAAIQYAEEVAPLDPRKMKARVNPNAVALIIGVESYSNLPPAQYADSDANHFYDYAHQALGVPISKIKLLTDAQASRIDLLMAMRSWMKAAVVGGKSDVYIFFAGHGLASDDGAKTYLLPADGNRDFLDETSILRDDLIASAKGAKTITLFLDTCYSGGTRTTEVLLADARPIAIVSDMGSLPPNVTLLAASSGAQLSSTYEAAQQGLFSYWLMKGLEGDADTNRDRKITTGELHDYVAKQVGPMAQRRNRQQDPQLLGDSARVLVSY